MVFISKTYSVYLHVFPDKKKYVGSTSQPLRSRWDGGLGYKNQKKMFSAILKFGWENVKHYLLFDGLDKKTAQTIESLLIHEWKTNMRGKGYNSITPLIMPPDDFVLPEYDKIEVEDNWNLSVNKRWVVREKNCSQQTYNCKSVKIIETGEVFKSASVAERHMGLPSGGVSRAARTPGASCGTCWITDEKEGWRMEVPAHWEYVEKK